MTRSRRPDRLLRLEEVTHIAGISTTTVYRLIREGKFPRALTVDRTMARWSWRAVQDWVAQVKDDAAATRAVAPTPATNELMRQEA